MMPLVDLRFGARNPEVDPDVEPWSGPWSGPRCGTLEWTLEWNLLKPALHISLRATRQPLFCFWKILCANVFDAGVNMRGLLIQPGQNRRR